MWFDLLLPVIYGTAGVGAGYAMFRRPGSEFMLDGGASGASVIEMLDQDASVNEAVDKLRQFTRTLAADVDAHQNEVEAVNASLLLPGEELSTESLCKAVHRLVEANELMQSQLQQAQEQIQLQAGQLESAERRAHTDALTKICNRRALDSHMAKRHAMGHGQAGTLVLFDVDFFKQFNDRYGHQTGDEVLRVIAGVLNMHLSSHGMVARFGGEEFAAVLDGLSVEEAVPIVENVRVAMGRREIPCEKKRLRVSASVGIAALLPNESIESWIQRADDCLYRAKNSGRDQGYWADGTTYRRVRDLEFHNQEARADSLAEANPSSDSLAGNGADESQSQPSSTNTPSQLSRNLFPLLPNRPKLRGLMEEIKEKDKSRGGRTNVSVMALQLAPAISAPACRSILQVVRSILRPADQVACDGATSLIVFMPNVSADTALQRAGQIHCGVKDLPLVNASQEDETAVLGIGVVPWDGGAAIDAIFDESKRLAVLGFRDLGQPIKFGELAPASAN